MIGRGLSGRFAAVGALLVVAVAIGSSARAALGPTSSPTGSGHGTHSADHAHESGVDALEGSNLDVLRGLDAVEALVESGTLGEIATEVGMDPHDLVDEFLGDPSVFLTENGLIGYADAFPLDGADSSPGALTVVPGGFDVSALSSMPSAARTLYLDFDGHVTSDLAWQSVGALTPIASVAYRCSPGAPTDVNAAIYEIWQRVSEDFAPFAINVTTADPGPAAILAGQRVVITPSNWVGSGVLGVALFNSFGSGFDRPAFVFSAGASVTTIAEAVSHEAGHTFGLSHDGLTAQGASPAAEYYDGHGVWAPIMGRSIQASTPVTQWSKGEYARANNGEDDVDRIRSRAGVRADDHGNSSTTATPMGSGERLTGLIGVSDVDVFAVDLPASSPLVVSLRPMVSRSNLYATVTVRDPGGAIIATGLPTAPPVWSAPVSIGSLPGGRYTIEVRPTGYLSPADGFSAYGSLGRYELAVNWDGSVSSRFDGPALAHVPAERLALRPSC